MTRVNLIPVKDLADQHLLAEHREIVRIPNQVRSGKLSGEGAPDRYVMGRGHVKFFADKISFLSRRYKEIFRECRLRGFDVTDMSSAFWPGPFDNDGWDPSEEEIAVSMARITEKLNAKPGFYRKTTHVILSA